MSYGINHNLKKSACIGFLGTIFTANVFMNCSARFTEQEIYFELPVKKTMNDLLLGYDSDGDKRITKDDAPQKDYFMISTKGDTVILRNTYHISNLLQELAIAADSAQETLSINLRQIQEPPAERISRRIRTHFWDDLTRTVDEAGLDRIATDEKMHDAHQRVYVPYYDSTGIAYFLELQKRRRNLEVNILPPVITPEYVRSINSKPGILTLKIKNGKGVPFVVPGGRFNEMYGWDSYFEGVGLILDGRADLAKAMVDNFCYQIKFYGKILNANRSYYLTRTQPPFLSSFIKEVYEAMPVKDKRWLAESLSMAIHEYETVWMQGKRFTPQTGLNRYYADGLGIPPETEPGHFREVLDSYAKKYNLSILEFEEQYKSGRIMDAGLDRYFVHDRTLRESGHDTSWRLDNVAADLNCVDVNALLYKYEADFQYLIAKYFDNEFTAENGNTYTTGYWHEKTATRKLLMKQYLWDKTAQCFYDYNIKKQRQTDFMSATNFFPLWAGLCTEEEAAAIVPLLLHELKAAGGFLASGRDSTYKYATNNVQRQWDYPNGWAPHQMMLWKGLLHYGYKAEAREMIYRWLYMITQNAVDYNGTIPEKYDVVKSTHKVYAEYGNVGAEFAYITRSGFGWMNASYQLGLSLLEPEYVQKLNNLEKPEAIFK
ncbi:trehalase [Flavobacterium cyanobacteriorum]|uniref:Trehalase n=1 Tax=Flavobacterium cyanobacteriorum TaxID=2022802 RepID=A0A255YU99_9FLAO|nr:trehalase family glycosidase [Flavobacterium cyanobacteriorum]OYQ32244.1 trehalase [Flavobacterium cyanobacteriorum]